LVEYKPWPHPIASRRIAEAAAIRAVYQQRGEFSAPLELRRRFPGITEKTGPGVRPHHRQLEAATTGEADATVTATALTPTRKATMLNEAHTGERGLTKAQR
jgi:hypothetical protein